MSWLKTPQSDSLRCHGKSGYTNAPQGHCLSCHMQYCRQLRWNFGIRTSGTEVFGFTVNTRFNRLIRTGRVVQKHKCSYSVGVFYAHLSFLTPSLFGFLLLLPSHTSSTEKRTSYRSGKFRSMVKARGWEGLKPSLNYSANTVTKKVFPFFCRGVVRLEPNPVNVGLEYGLMLHTRAPSEQ